MAHILLVEDDEAFAHVIAKRVRADGHTLEHCVDGHHALNLLDAGIRFDVMVIDLRLPIGTPNGLSVARLAIVRRPDLPLVFMTAHRDIADDVQGSVPSLLIKSDDASNIAEAVQTALAA